MKDQMLEAWAINGRVNGYFVEAIDDSVLWSKANKGKAPAAQFAHIHSVRMMWLKASAPDLLDRLERVEEGASKVELAAALVASGDRMATMIGDGLDSGRIKGFKPHAVGFVAYLLAHEAHHRGQAELILRQLGVPLSDKVSYGLWEWGSR